MKKPVIELRKIQVHVGLSEETPAYTATLYVDGEAVAEVSNQGHGGGDMYHAIKGAQKDVWDRINKIDARVKATYPKHEFHGMTLDESLEGLCHGLVWEHVEQRNFRSMMSRKTVLMDEGKIYTLKAKASDPRVKPFVEKKYPKATILNELPFDKAWELYKENVERA